ncbi:MAG: DUF2065 domain-containing protein [Burkholderiaceae bacterium]
MEADEWWLVLGQALALVLVLEGLLPLAWPGGWRKVFAQLLEMSDGQLRFFGLCSALLGLVMLWFFGT